MFLTERPGNTLLLSPGEGSGPVGSSGEAPPSPPPADKQVPERDLLAVKARSTELESKLADLQTQHNTSVQETARERATRERLEGELAIAKTNLQQIETLKAESLAHKTRADALELTLLTGRRQLLVDRYGLKPEQVKDWSSEKLATAEEALALAHPHAIRANYDRGGNSTGTLSDLTARAAIKRGLDELGAR